MIYIFVTSFLRSHDLSSFTVYIPEDGDEQACKQNTAAQPSFISTGKLCLHHNYDNKLLYVFTFSESRHCVKVIMELYLIIYLFLVARLLKQSATNLICLMCVCMWIKISLTLTHRHNNVLRLTESRNTMLTSISCLR